MVTIQEAKKQIEETKKAISERKEQIAAVKQRTLSRAELQRQTQQTIARRKIEASQLTGVKRKAELELKPIEAEITKAEKEVLRAEAIQKQTKKELEDYNKAVNVYDEYRIGDKRVVFTLENQQQKEIFRKLLRSEKRAEEELYRKIKSTGAIPKVEGGKLVGVEFEQTEAIMDKLRNIGIDVSGVTIKDLPSRNVTGKTLKTQVEVMSAPKVTSIEPATTREKVSGFFRKNLGFNIPSTSQTFNVFTGRERRAPITQRAIEQTIYRGVIGLGTIAEEVTKKGAEEFKVEKIRTTVPQTVVPQRVTIGGEFVLPKVDEPFISKEGVGKVARVGTELGTFVFGGAPVVYGFAFGQASKGLQQIKEGKVKEGILNIGGATILTGIEGYRTVKSLVAPSKITQGEVLLKPMTETISKPVIVNPSISKEGDILYKITQKSETITTPGVKEGLERSKLFDEPLLLISNPQKRITTVSAVATEKDILGVAVEGRVGKTQSNLRNIFGFEGSGKVLDKDIDFTRLSTPEKKVLFEGLGGPDKILISTEERKLSTSSMALTDLGSITTLNKGGVNIRFPKPGETLSKKIVASETKKLGKDIFGSTYFKSKVSAIDVTKNIFGKGELTAEDVSIIVTKPRYQQKDSLSVDKITKNLLDKPKKTSLGIAEDTKDTIKTKPTIKSDVSLDKLNEVGASAGTKVASITSSIPVKKPVSPTQKIFVQKEKETRGITSLVTSKLTGDASSTETRFSDMFPRQDSGFLTGVIRPTPKTIITTDVPPIIREGVIVSDPIMKIDTNLLSDTRIIGKQKISSATSLLEEQQVIQSPLIKTTILPMTETITNLREEERSLGRQSYLLGTKQEQEQLLKTSPKTISKQRQDYFKPTRGPPIVLPPGVKDTQTVRKLIKLREKGMGVNIETGMKIGKKRTIARNLQPFTALKKAQKYVDRNIEASFRLVESGKKAVGKKSKPTNIGMKFRPSKTNALFMVEKRKYRLDSPGERRQIKLGKKTIKKGKKKKKQGFSL